LVFYLFYPDLYPKKVGRQRVGNRSLPFFSPRIGCIIGGMIASAATPPDESPLLTPREAAARLSVSEKTLHRLSAPKGTIPVVRIGTRGVRFTPAALNQWIADQQAASLAQTRPSKHNGRRTHDHDS
jgi:excisionase family DNA binding protein